MGKPCGRITRLWRVYIPPKADPPSEEGTTGLPVKCSINFSTIKAKPLISNMSRGRKATGSLRQIGTDLVRMAADIYLCKFVKDSCKFVNKNSRVAE